MYRVVETFVRNCLTCIRHQKTPIWDHPALTLPIRDVGDRVQIDLVFGLPSKESQEIARKYFEYISIFGSSKELLSDQEKEFLNKMMEKLIKLSGTERLNKAKMCKSSHWNPEQKFLLEYPICKVNLRQNSEDLTPSLEEQIKDRTRRGIKEYFVKWADYPVSENSWIRESDFVSMECIDQYLKSKIDQNEINTVRGARSLTHLRMISTFITNLLALGPFCTLNDHSPILSTSRLCSYNTFESNFHSELYNVLEKTQFYLNGYRFICTRDKISVRTYETFFGQRIHEKMVANENFLEMNV
ncbi:hypothetical protein BpHYR1_002582 [Brachionus plicatilis]|uniref:Chromo domain-containing protein n=1 Tax=Brachionus plicatilis TaxID=10195 RepID=A0A3M7P6X6_BRAPC|nr:hypothetical protein BpHYR1_002582 [Brachionus plicatilis]